MAKSKKYISSKVKPKRKFALGGSPEQELYLNDNVTYQAKDGPTQQMQQDFNARQQARAEQMANLQQSMVNQQMMTIRAANAAEEERKKKEEEGRKAEEQAAKDKAIGTVTTGASNIGKDLLQSTITPTGTTLASKAAPSAAKPIMMHQGTASTGAFNTGTKAATGVKTAETAGQMSNIASAGTSLGLIAAGEGVDYWAKHRQEKIDTGRGYSDYYRDTHYTAREAAGQIGKSTLKGAGYGVTLGHAVPGIGEAVGAAIGTQAGLMVGTGIAAKQYYDTKGVKVFGKQYGAKNKYDENLDPNVIAKREQQKQMAALANTATAMDNARLSSMTQYDTNTGNKVGMAKYGGKFKVGGQIEYLKGGMAIPIGPNAVKYIGNTHEEGGISGMKDAPEAEVEDNETATISTGEDTGYVFSASVKTEDGETFAQAHERLVKEGAPSYKIKELALKQEVVTGRDPNKIKNMKFKYGGIVEYKRGGLFSKDEESNDEETNLEPPKNISPEELLKRAHTAGYLTVEEYQKNKFKYNRKPPRGKEGYALIYAIAKEEGDPFPEVTAAQWAQESGWGKSATGKFNYFGQTAKKGEKSTTLGTPRDPGGGKKSFVDYNSIRDSVADHVKKWAPVYKNAKSPQEALMLLQNNGGGKRYAQGWPTKEFPQGDWKGYVDVVSSIIQDNQHVLKTHGNAVYYDPKVKYNFDVLSPNFNAKKFVPGYFNFRDAAGKNRDYFSYNENANYGVNSQDNNLASNEGTAIGQPNAPKLPSPGTITPTDGPIDWLIGALAGGAGLGTVATKGAVKIGTELATQEEQTAESAAQLNALEAQAARAAQTGEVVANTGLATRPVYQSQYFPINSRIGLGIKNSETGLATEGQWMADANAVNADTPGFPIDYGNTAVGAFRGSRPINITGRTISPENTRIGLGSKMLYDIPALKFNYQPFSPQLNIKTEENPKVEPEVVPTPEPTPTPTPETPPVVDGVVDPNIIKNYYKTPKLNFGKRTLPELPVTKPESAPVAQKEPPMNLPVLPEEARDLSGLANLAGPLAATMLSPKYKDITPTLLSTAGVGPGAVGRINLARPDYSNEQKQNIAMFNAIKESNIAGPGDVANKIAAATKASEMALKIKSAEETARAGVANQEAIANTSISTGNATRALQYQAQQDQLRAMNTKILNDVNAANTEGRNNLNYSKYGTQVNATQSAANTFLNMQREKNLENTAKFNALANDPYGSLQRTLYLKQINDAANAGVEGFAGTTQAERNKMAREYYAQLNEDATSRKYGGKKYVSRLGDLVNKRNKKF